MFIQFRSPARFWTEALPIGNGNLGGMIFGGVEKERIALNEDTLWSGNPKNWNNQVANEVLSRMRESIEGERYAEADLLGKEMMGPYTQSYLPFGDLRLKMDHGNVYSDYERRLDLTTGVISVVYRIGEIQYTREIFASFPDKCIVVRLSSSKPGALSFLASLEGSLRYESFVQFDQFIVSGTAPEQISPPYYDVDDPVRYGDPEHSSALQFHGRLAVSHENGAIIADTNGVRVHGATTATLYFSAATSFDAVLRASNKQNPPDKYTARVIEAVLSKRYEEIRKDHLADHAELFNRVSLQLGDRKTPLDIPTPDRIAKYGSDDLGLVELLFQFGRYLMIASSRPGTQPANLQGIWNEETRAPWSSNYTLNINTEMNYWPAESCNLPELHEPLIEFIRRLAANGKKTAQINYGARGWVAHHNSDIWGQTSPVGDYGHGDPVWALWPMGGVWLTQHLWEHYAFSGDETFLRDTAYPVMKEAALFCLDWLYENKEGWLITAPSTSPEHKFRIADETYAISAATTMDISLIGELFMNCRLAAIQLRTDEAFVQTLSEASEKLMPLQIGSQGQLQEWFKDFRDEDEHHRHVSHLVGVYPGRLISEQASPSLFNAAKTSLELRGDGGTGWSLGWKIGLWARFKDGNRAEKLISNLLTLIDGDEPQNTQRGGVYANLFDAHPPFQIDGNFAATSGVAEMLLQSHQGFLELLPALPDRWFCGKVTGLRARGGYEVELEWKSGQLTGAAILSNRNQTCKIKLSQQINILAEGEPIPLQVEEGLVRFQVEKGKTYVLAVV
ncbi:glycoside hydrolase N-terminal domain-containing protein [Paenibacillus sp. GCM10012307]|uniref:Glycoside hydrolase family 95 protein n=1 Tax=Paenibacillus roseus TaxID=2798579 RepID=A0A934MQ87_9BACL|nr:glycoside hydrolase family 95 protein [Paenibacillus roseus]MBJ6361149.1 glycoside hydrolase family 95 protein [Paenibacillus roseus]